MMRVGTARRRLRLKEAGLCTVCRKNELDKHESVCNECYERRKRRAGFRENYYTPHSLKENKGWEYY